MIALGFVFGIIAACILFIAAAIPSLSPEGDGENPYKGMAFVIGIILGAVSAFCFYLR